MGHRFHIIVPLSSTFYDCRHG